MSRIAALVLAAGRSRRMGVNKLILPLDGKPLIRHALDAIAASRLVEATVVLGFEPDKARAALSGVEARFVVNRDFDRGLSTSLKAGLAAVAPDIDGAMIFLADMPDIAPGLIDRMIAAFAPDAGRAIVVPLRCGRRGHPVLWGRQFFPLILREAQGDCGAGRLLAEQAGFVAAVEAESAGVLRDLDTRQDFFRRARMSRIA